MVRNPSNNGMVKDISELKIADLASHTGGAKTICKKGQGIDSTANRPSQNRGEWYLQEQFGWPPIFREADKLPHRRTIQASGPVKPETLR